MSNWLKGIVLIILLLVVFNPSAKFKISDYYKEFICMKENGKSRNICKKKISEKKLVKKKVRSKEMFDKLIKEKFGKKVTPPKK